jgi:hypothetical protein
MPVGPGRSRMGAESLLLSIAQADAAFQLGVFAGDGERAYRIRRQMGLYLLC